MKYVLLLLLLALPAMLLAQYNGGIGRGDFASAIVGNTETNIFSENDQMPVDNGLGQNYPNPFNPTTKIEYSLATSEWVILKVYDLLGREVATLVNQEIKSGHQTSIWDATKNSSGVYIYRLQAGSFIKTKRMVLIK